MALRKGILAYVDPSGTQQSIGVSVVGVYYGAMTNASEVINKKYHSAYFYNTVFDNFKVSIMTFPYLNYKAVSEWLLRYANITTDDNNPSPIPMTCVVRFNKRGVQNFAGVGVLDNGGSFGDRVGMLSYPMMLEFVGAANLLDPLSAKFSTNTGGQPLKSSPYYPSGNQAKGAAQTTEEVLYNQFLSPTFVPSAVF